MGLGGCALYVSAHLLFATYTFSYLEVEVIQSRRTSLP